MQYVIFISIHSITRGNRFESLSRNQTILSDFIYGSCGTVESICMLLYTLSKEWIWNPKFQTEYHCNTVGIPMIYSVSSSDQFALYWIIGFSNYYVTFYMHQTLLILTKYSIFEYFPKFHSFLTVSLLNRNCGCLYRLFW